MVAVTDNEEDGTAEDATEKTIIKLPIDIEDEVSWVIHEFRRQGSPIHSIENGNGGNRTFHTKKTSKKRPYPGYFSSVRYCLKSSETTTSSQRGQIPYIEVSYLFDKVLSLKFYVYIRLLGISSEGGNDSGGNQISYETSVAFTDDGDTNSLIKNSLPREQRDILRAKIRSICESLNDNHSGKKSSSLFAILSKLLMSLNQLQTQVIGAKNVKNKNGAILRSILPDREKNLHLERLGRSCCSGGVDLAILLLRCAAMGKHAEQFAHPFPRSNGLLAETIWYATEGYQRFERKRKRCKRPKTKSPVVFHPSEHVLLGFLSSLPWMKRGKITVAQKSCDSNETEPCDGQRIQVCLELDEKSDDASYSPRFARLVRKHGGLTVYHGTHMENAWSILHNGFFNPSEIGRGANEFVKNGAMLGSGVYLTTSQKVATFFATTNAPTQKVKSALKHDSLTNLLSMTTDAKNLLMTNESDGRAALIDDLYEVSCFPVFEARIIRPLEKEGDLVGKAPSAAAPSRQRCNTNNTSSSIASCSTSTRRDGKYYVVPDARDVRITKLHLTFELTQKNRGNLLLSNFLLSFTPDDSTCVVLAVLLGLIMAFAFGTRI